MQKLIPKIDAEKELICAFMDPEMNDKGTKGGAPGGKEGKPPKAAPAAFWLILFDNAMTPAGVGGFLVPRGNAGSRRRRGWGKPEAVASFHRDDWLAR